MDRRDLLGSRGRLVLLAPRAQHQLLPGQQVQQGTQALLALRAIRGLSALQDLPAISGLLARLAQLLPFLGRLAPRVRLAMWA